MPLRAHVKERGPLFKRFDVVWTPTVLVLDQAGKERYRLEGYLPTDEFNAQIRLGLARVSVMNKQWPDAEKVYAEIVDKFGNTLSAAEALYWQGVCRYERTHDHHALNDLTAAFRQRYTNTLWAKKASIW